MNTAWKLTDTQLTKALRDRGLWEATQDLLTKVYMNHYEIADKDLSKDEQRLAHSLSIYRILQYSNDRGGIFRWNGDKIKSRNPEDDREGKRNPFFSDIDLTLDGVQFVFDELDRRLAENDYKINWNAQIKNNILKRLKESARYAHHLELNTATLQYLLKSVPQKNIIKITSNPLGLSKKAFAGVKEQAEEIADAIVKFKQSYPIETALSLVASQYQVPIALVENIMMRDKRNNNKRSKRKPDLSRFIQNPAPILVKVEWGRGDVYDTNSISQSYRQMANDVGLDFEKHVEIRFKRDQPFYDKGKYEVWVTPKLKKALENEGYL